MAFGMVASARVESAEVMLIPVLPPPLNEMANAQSDKMGEAEAVDAPTSTSRMMSRENLEVRIEVPPNRALRPGWA
jgi:hypothetical protein